MGGIETMAAAIGADLAARLPRQNKKQREGLALLVATALDVRDVNLMELAAALPRAAEADCVVVDLGLPDAMGLEALHRLTQAVPGMAVVVLTGLDDPQAGLDALAAGAQGYLVKGRVAGGVLLVLLHI